MTKAADSIVIRRATAEDAGAIDAYVKGHPQGVLFHLSGWSKAVSQTYDYETATLIAERGGALCGVLPLIDVRAPLLGRSFISTAFAVGGGPIGDDGGVLSAFGEEAMKIGEANGARYVECRSDADLGSEWIAKEGVYAGFQLPLTADEDNQLSAIPRKRRAEVRKAIKAASAGALRVSLSKDIDRFYTLYAAAMRDHGTPIFPKAFLRRLFENFSGDVEISFVEYEETPVAALWSFYFKDRVMPYYIGALPQARALRAAELLYWAQMRRAVDKGATLFDFGRSKVGSGPYHFKKLWGADPQPLTYRVHLVGAKALPDVNPNNPKFAAFVSIWRRLPLFAANALGPVIARNFP